MDTPDWLSYLFGYAIALMLLPGRPITASGMVRRLILLFGVLTTLFLSLQGFGSSRVTILAASGGNPESAPLRFPLTALAVLLIAAFLAMVHVSYAGSTAAVASWARRYAGAPSAVVLLASAIGFATAFNKGGLIALSAAVLALLVFIALCVFVLPERLVAFRTRRLNSGTSEDRAETLKAENDIRASLLQAASGIVLVAGVVFTFLQLTSAQEATQRQLELTVAGQTADRFTRAVDQLDADNAVDVQLGGIYSLDRIADETEEYHEAIAGTLSAYVATRRPLTPAPADSRRVRVDTVPNLQAALSVLVKQREVPLAAELPNTDLFGADLSDATLRLADLSGSLLDDADLRQATIEYSDLRDVSFRRTDLQGVSMSNVDLRNSDLSDADVIEMLLEDVNLAGANLSTLRAEDIFFVSVFGSADTEWPSGFDSTKVPTGVCEDIPPDGARPPGC